MVGTINALHACRLSMASGVEPLEKVEEHKIQNLSVKFNVHVNENEGSVRWVHTHPNIRNTVGSEGSWCRRLESVRGLKAFWCVFSSIYSSFSLSFFISFLLYFFRNNNLCCISFAMGSIRLSLILQAPKKTDESILDPSIYSACPQFHSVIKRFA